MLRGKVLVGRSTDESFEESEAAENGDGRLRMNDGDGDEARKVVAIPAIVGRELFGWREKRNEKDLSE